MTKASEYTKKWREAFKNRDLEGFKRYRTEEREKYRAKNPQEYKNNKSRNSWKRSLKYCYKMTLEEWDALYESQEGLCALCGLPSIGNERLAVDHNHITGKIRALVHRMPCNLIIGYVENYEILCYSAAEYLKKHNT